MITVLQVCLFLEFLVHLRYELLLLGVLGEAVLLDVELTAVLCRAPVNGPMPSAAAISGVRLPLVGEAQGHLDRGLDVVGCLSLDRAANPHLHWSLAHRKIVEGALIALARRLVVDRPAPGSEVYLFAPVRLCLLRRHGPEMGTEYRPAQRGRFASLEPLVRGTCLSNHLDLSDHVRTVYSSPDGAVVQALPHPSKLSETDVRAVGLARGRRL